jgi:hypothetical protein
MSAIYTKLRCRRHRPTSPAAGHPLLLGVGQWAFYSGFRQCGCASIIYQAVCPATGNLKYSELKEK